MTLRAGHQGHADCWNSIGVHGDRSCPELVQHVHCRNCPVYSGAAAKLLDRESPADYIAEWTKYVAAPASVADAERRSVLIFRLGAEWLALPSPAVAEVSERRAIHSVPHRRRGAMLGLVNIRGELLVCMSLVRLLDLDSAPQGPSARRLLYQRMLVLRRDDARIVCAVDEVHGLHSFQSRTLNSLPATVAKGAATHASGVLEWQGKSVGVLDDGLLFTTFQRSLG
jgi:chemotaxis-related protein WspD